MKFFHLDVLSKFNSMSVIAACALLASGCVSLTQETCEQFEERTKDADYATQYRNSETDLAASTRNFRSLPKNTSAVARLYKLELDPTTINPCRHVTLHKELYLLRSAKEEWSLKRYASSMQVTGH